MIDPSGEDFDGSTPLTEEELEQLIPSYITWQHELNEAEQANILEAGEWAFLRKRDVLTERFLDNLHDRMFRRVWRWAGKHRQSRHLWARRNGYPISSSPRMYPCLRQREWTPCPTRDRFAPGGTWTQAFFMGQSQPGRCR